MMKMIGKKLKTPFVNYRVLLVDLDGVLWRGNKILWKNIEALRIWQNLVEIFYTTNNSTRHRKFYVKRIKNLGLKADINHVITSGSMVAELLSKKYGKGNAYVIGEEGLIEELKSVGIEFADNANVKYLIVGLDRKLTYEKLCKGLRALMNGAIFIATNEDATVPINDTLYPGAGSIVAALKVASNMFPEIVAGKPSPWMYLKVIEKTRIKIKEMLVIGDRIDTDIIGANRLNIDSLLVLTGVTESKDLENINIKPTYVMNTLQDVFI